MRHLAQNNPQKLMYYKTLASQPASQSIYSIGLVVFYCTSTAVGDLMPNPVYTFDLFANSLLEHYSKIRQSSFICPFKWLPLGRGAVGVFYFPSQQGSYLFNINEKVVCVLLKGFLSKFDSYRLLRSTLNRLLVFVSVQFIVKYTCLR